MTATGVNFHLPPRGQISPAVDTDEPFQTFDEFGERLNVTPNEYPHAFAAWLDRNWNWDGRYERIDDED